MSVEERQHIARLLAIVAAVSGFLSENDRRIVLAPAFSWDDDRVLVHENRTVVF